MPRCGGIRSAGILREQSPASAAVPGAAWGCQAWCRTAPLDPGLTTLLVGFAGWVVSELQQAQLSCSGLLFLPPLHSC